MALSQPFVTTAHPYISPTNPHAYSCAYERGKSSSGNALVYIGGLTSGPHTAVDLVSTLLSTFDENALEYSIWESRMRSSFTRWGYSSLENDAEDIAALVKYLKSLGKKRIVLMGSSIGEKRTHLKDTWILLVDSVLYWQLLIERQGYQDCMKYMETLEIVYSDIAACILQAPSSDRVTAGMLMTLDLYRRTLQYSGDLIAQGKKDSIMPQELIPDIFTSPITAHRWHSLIAKG